MMLRLALLMILSAVAQYPERSPYGLIVNSGKGILGCLTGPDVPVYNQCAVWNDLNGDGHVDLRDYAEYQNEF